MVGLIQRILGRTSHPLNRIYISKSRLISNYKTLSKINPKIKITPVLKSNAYGHGISEVGKIVNKLDTPFVCVDSLYEALQLRKAGVKSEILIMGYIDPESLKNKKYDFSFALWDLELAEVLNKYQKGAKVHIFVDTGMNREGIKLKCTINNDQLTKKGNCCLEHFLDGIIKLKNLKITGLMSHLACADDPKNPLNSLQLNNFKKAKGTLLKFSLITPGWKPKWYHLGGSYGLLNLKLVECNAVRVGKALYGIADSGLNLKPILKFTSKIVQIKSIKKGEKIGYSSTFTPSKDLKIAVLPLGYNDGFDRRLSNTGVVRVGGVGCKILGLISMNVAVVDISNVLNPYLGQEVIIFSDNPEDKNSVENSAKICKTISYELLVHLHPSTKRELV